MGDVGFHKSDCSEFFMTTRPRGRPKSFNDKSEQNTVRALDRAMHILKAVSDADGITLTDLAASTQQSPATVYRVLTTLEAHGVVEAEGETQLWYVGSVAFRIGSTFMRRTKLAERARVPMQELTRSTGETANLGIEQGDEVLFLTQIETHEAIRAFFPPGMKSPMHASGIGKALLAWYPSQRLAQVIAARGQDRFTDHTLETPKALSDDLSETRARGFAIDDQERADGMRCIAAPIFNGYGEAVAGVSVSGPAFRLPLVRCKRIGQEVAAAAQTITEAIGGTSPGPRAR